MRNLYSIVNTTACQISTKENEIKGKNLMGKEESFGLGQKALILT